MYFYSWYDFRIVGHKRSGAESRLGGSKGIVLNIYIYLAVKRNLNFIVM